MKRRRSPRTMRAIVAAAFIAAAWGGLAAQDRRLLDANGYVRDDAYARPLVPAADQKYLKIDGLKMKDKAALKSFGDRFSAAETYS